MDLKPEPEPQETPESPSVPPESDRKPSSKSKSKLELGAESARNSDPATAVDSETTRKPSSPSQPQLDPTSRTSSPSPRQQPSGPLQNGGQASSKAGNVAGDGACAPFYICFAAAPAPGMNGGPAAGAGPAYPGSYGQNPECSQISEAQALQMLQNSCSPGRSRRSQFGQGMSGGQKYGYNAAAGSRMRSSRSEYRQGMQPPLCCCCCNGQQQGYQQQMQRPGPGYSPGPMDPRIPTDAMGQMISPAQGGSPYRSRSRKSVPLLTSYTGTSEKGVIATGTNDTGIMTETGQPQPYMNAADCLPKGELYRSQYPDMMSGLQTCIPQMCMPNVPGGVDFQQFIQFARMKSEMESNPCYPQIMKALKCMGLVTGDVTNCDGDEDGEGKKKKKKSKKKKSKSGSKDKKKKKKGSKDKKKKKKGSKDKKKKKKK